MRLKFATAGLAAALAWAAMASAASATPQLNDLTVQGLATQIEAALNRIGCTATKEQDIVAIQSVIAASGASPAEAEAALARVRTFTSICGNDSAALASVDHTIALAISRGDPSGGPGGGLAFGGPIGAPAVFVGTEGTNYTP